MKIRVFGLFKMMAITAILGFVWFIYGNYFLVKNIDGSYDFVNNGDSTVFLVSAIIITFIGVYLVANFFQRWLNKRSFSRSTSKLAGDLIRLYCADDFLDKCRRFGISMNHSDISIRSEILARCSLDNLAGLVVLIFHKHSQSDLNFVEIFYSLADLIIEFWPEEVIEEFVQLFDNRDIILGGQLKYAIDYQRVNREVAEFNRIVEGRLEEIENKHHKKMSVENDKFDNEFQHYNYLLSGGSAFKHFFCKRLPLKYLWKPAIAK